MKYLLFTQTSSSAILALMFVVFAEQFLAELVGLIPSNYYLVLGNKDAEGFRQYTIKAVLLVAAMALVSKHFFLRVIAVQSYKLRTSYLVIMAF